jgi:8-oxo-dGTP pyrophosphatase MutT (NUDIX family)
MDRFHRNLTLDPMIEFDQQAPPELAAALTQALTRGISGRSASRAMAPDMAYGRHHGPVPDGARKAAVLIVVEPTASGWSLPTIVRPATMKAHAGQVSLPGGMVEAGETAIQTALREFHEELGADPAKLQVLGTLAPIFVFISNFVVTPVVAISPQPLTLTPSPDEVAEVLPVPLVRLVDPACRSSLLIRRGELAFLAPCFDIAGRQIWGATSLILAEFAALLRSAAGGERK